MDINTLIAIAGMIGTILYTSNNLSTKMEKRFGSIDTKLETSIMRHAQHDKNINDINLTVDKIESRLELLEKEIVTLQIELNKLKK